MAPVTSSVHCASVLLAEGWAHDAVLTIDGAGTLTGVDVGRPAASAPGALHLAGPVVPGMPNLHSHAFQRAIAGCTQRQSGTADSFWTWREAMYGSLARIGPEELEAIAAGLYVELLEGGFTSVAEFHYVHHDPRGLPYADPCELSLRVLEAARTAGIGLTHLPVLYMTGGFDGRPLGSAQARFAGTPDAVMDQILRLHTTLVDDPDRTVGLALHSLRAVPPDALAQVVASLSRVLPRAPIHVHIAEQTAEVEACLAHRGARPVDWLLDHAPVDDRWCLVHATHIDTRERRRMAEAGVVAGLCPTTEADLGDGVFPAEAWVAGGGWLGVGTDSHVGRSAAEELRWLEYGQRLFARRRNVLRWPGEAHTGAAAWRAAVRGGARALARRAGGLAVGCRADLVELDADAPGLAGLTGDTCLDAWIFGGSGPAVRTVVVGGRVRVQHGHHVDRPAVMDRFRSVLARVRS